MTSAAKLAANQANSQLSTGPKTPEGKATSSANSTKHGFQSASVLLPGEDPADYQALLDELTQHFSARDLTEQRCVREMADAEWRLRRARRFQESTAKSTNSSKPTPNATSSTSKLMPTKPSPPTPAFSYF
jgi:hypothetical protein